MKKMKKVLALTACASMLVTASVMGTLAYLTSQDTVVNTFTVGKVNIELDEAKVNTDGTYATNHANRVKANEYHLIPGRTFYKDPTVTVLKGSEDAYVRMLVKVTDMEQLKAVFNDKEYYGADGVFLLQNLVSDWDSTTWKFEGYTEEDGEIVVSNTAEGGESSATEEKRPTKIGVYEFRYFDVVYAEDVNKAEGDGKVLDDLFETITLPGEDVTSDNIDLLKHVKIDVIAQAIQTVGFEENGEKTAEDVAWAAFVAPNK